MPHYKTMQYNLFLVPYMYTVFTMKSIFVGDFNTEDGDNRLLRPGVVYALSYLKNEQRNHFETDNAKKVMP